MPADLAPWVDGLAEGLAARPAVLLAGLLGLAVVLTPTTWRATRTVVTIAHEGGHAVVAVLAGRGLAGIRLHPDTSGVTVSTGAGRGIGIVAMYLAGYLAPPLLGLGGALLVAAGRSDLTLWVAVGLLALTLLAVRNVFGWLAVLLVAGGVGAVAWFGGPELRTGFAAALVWFLLFGGLRAVRELQRGRRGVRRGTATSDADALAALTGVPGGAWAAVFWLFGVAALLVGGWVLLF